MPIMSCYQDELIPRCAQQKLIFSMMSCYQGPCAFLPSYDKSRKMETGNRRIGMVAIRFSDPAGCANNLKGNYTK